jgi:YD repeat-containing protein
VDWSAVAVQLELEEYHVTTTYDALNRVMTTTRPGSSIIRKTYSVASLLQSIEVNLQGNGTWLTILADLRHNAKGQRILAVTNKGVQTTYMYDPLTFYLVDMLTTRNASDFPGDCPQPPVSGWPGCQIQSLHYAFDPVGNITNIRDDAQQTIFFQNQRVEPSNDYTYDALYRLIEATSREHIGQAGIPMPNGPSTTGDAWVQNPSDGKAMGRYTESSYYDAVGNIQSLRTKPGWTRNYTYAENSLLRAGGITNRLSSTSIRSSIEYYGYDGNEGLAGNTASMAHLSL